MAQNFLVCDREQELLLPPSVREWLPEGHPAWFVIGAVAQLDLSAFYAGYRADGHGRAAHDQAVIVALLLYCYAIGERSSRRVDRRCVEDVAIRVMCANHTRIAATQRCSCSRAHSCMPISRRCPPLPRRTSSAPRGGRGHAR